MNVEAPGGAPAAETSALVARLAADKSAALARLASGVAHELRNPLAVILARAQLMALGLRQGRPVEAAKLDTTLRTIEEQALRACRIIESLSIFARPRPPEIDPLDAGRLLADVLGPLRGRAESAGVAIEVEVEEAPVTLGADRGQLGTALTHLVVNALEAMPGDGHLAVRVRRGEDCVEIAVSDSGPGVARHDADRIFDPFFTTKPAAAGLGLCVAQTIAEAHGGALRLVAAGAVGAEFVLSLPTRS